MLLKDPPVELIDRLWMLGTNEYPLFLTRGERECTIFEGGTGAMGPVLKRQLAELDIAGETVRQVVVTHAHPDHVMAVPMFRQAFPDVTVLASEAAAKTLSAEKAISFFRQVDAALTGALLKAGAITEQDRPEAMEDKQIGIDRLIREGDTIAVEAGAFTVLETPGHSDCSLSFHDPERGILIISDATGYYIPEHGYWWPNYFTGYAAYLDSIRRLAGLDAEVLCLSHNGVIRGAEDVKAYFSGAISATEEYHRRIVDEAKAGKDGRKIAEELGCEVYEKTQLLPVDFFQKNCSLLVKQSLGHEGIGRDA
jgi:glyoxylase-like metal-dependent hydrolase (beta-lactamase superfamily II)